MQSIVNPLNNAMYLHYLGNVRPKMKPLDVGTNSLVKIIENERGQECPNFPRNPRSAD